MNPECIVCRKQVLKSTDAASEILCWESETGLSEKEYTGRVAHLVCMQGGVYDDKQMTITEVMGTDWTIDLDKGTHVIDMKKENEK